MWPEHKEGRGMRVDWQCKDAGMLSITWAWWRVSMCFSCYRHAMAFGLWAFTSTQRLYQPWCLTPSLKPDRGQRKDRLGTGSDPEAVGGGVLVGSSLGSLISPLGFEVQTAQRLTPRNHRRATSGTSAWSWCEVTGVWTCSLNGVVTPQRRGAKLCIFKM